MSKIFFAIPAIILLLSSISFSQNSRWENLTDLKNVSSIAADPNSNNIYCATKGGLFSANAITGVITAKYTNIQGLISNDLTAIASDNQGRLWIGASDGSISILNPQNSTWKYIYDIKNSTESNKFINYILHSGNFMYVATGYGIQKISAVNFSFVDAPYYRLGVFSSNTPVYSLTVNGNTLYAATKSGVAYANIITSNLNDPNSWTNYNQIPLNADVKAIETYDNKIFAGSLSGFMYFDGANWSPYPNAAVSAGNIKSIKSIQGNIYFISIYFSNSSDLSVITNYLNPNDYSVLGSSSSNAFPVAGLSNNGIILYSKDTTAYTFPNSPFTNIFNQITINNDNSVWAAGGLPSNGFYKYNGSEWENFNLSTHPEIGNSNWFQKIISGNGNVWALGFGGGPTLIRGNTIQNFNTTNSNLPGISNDPNFCVPNGGAYDNNGILWLSFYGTNTGSSLYTYSGDNSWFGYQNPSTITSATLSNMAIDSYNTKWVTSGGSRPGLYFFNENTTYSNTNDDIYGFYNNSDFGAEVTNVYDVIIDKNNEVWIATNNGVFIINNPFAAIQNPNLKPPPVKLGIISGNLRVPFTENCISITYDVLNNKWIGTETNGVFQLSSDGSTLLAQYNTQQSPIIGNQIKTVSVSSISGKAFFGTNSGMSSFQTDAIEPVAEFDEITVSPNPFILPSNVNLKIDGLIENSSIKIISVSGEIVTEFDSPGGRIATWNGYNQNNELTASGIYIIVAFNSDGSKVGKGKVAIVRK
ncbi:MAG TPA: two-component regulator propeller domain-containing protein [Ignavibacteria bacterium]|nr:two-component regulator propeller domain-containing protein [Ignavibacteria bacterium]